MRYSSILSCGLLLPVVAVLLVALWVKLLASSDFISAQSPPPPLEATTAIDDEAHIVFTRIKASLLHQLNFATEVIRHWSGTNWPSELVCVAGLLHVLGKRRRLSPWAKLAYHTSSFILALVGISGSLYTLWNLGAQVSAVDSLSFLKGVLVSIKIIHPRAFFAPLTNIGPLFLLWSLILDFLAVALPYTIYSDRFDHVIRFLAPMCVTTFAWLFIEMRICSTWYFTAIVGLLLMGIISMRHGHQPLSYPKLSPFTKDDEDQWTTAALIGASWWQEKSLLKHEYIVAEFLASDGKTRLFLRVERSGENPGWLSLLTGMDLRQELTKAPRLRDLTFNSNIIAKFTSRDNSYSFSSFLKVVSHARDWAPKYSLPTFNCWWLAQRCFSELAREASNITITIRTGDEWLSTIIEGCGSFPGRSVVVPCALMVIHALVPTVQLWDRETTLSANGLRGFCDRWRRKHVHVLQRTWTISTYRMIMDIRTTRTFLSMIGWDQGWATELESDSNQIVLFFDFLYWLSAYILVTILAASLRSDDPPPRSIYRSKLRSK